MNVEALQSILIERLEADRDGPEFRLPEDREVDALLNTGRELMHVTNVRVIEFGDDVTTLVTRQAEYFVEATDVFGLKLDGSRIQPHEARPGFRREGS